VNGQAALASLLAHGAGDYVIQSDWMAMEKTKAWPPALAHAVSYGLPFLALTRNPKALAVIVGTHAVIDRYRLARHLVWAKNQLAPARHRHPWAECIATGYHPSRPDWLTVWLLIAADNIAHVAINTAALTRWGHR
jgi:hypothetical protein